MDEVERLVKNRVQTTGAMKTLLRSFVAREIHPAPSLNDTSFYPTNSTICTTIYRTRVKLGMPTTVEKNKGEVYIILKTIDILYASFCSITINYYNIEPDNSCTI